MDKLAITDSEYAKVHILCAATYQEKDSFVSFNVEGTETALQEPSFVAFSNASNLFAVSDSKLGLILTFDVRGIFNSVVKSREIGTPHCICFSSQGALFGCTANSSGEAARVWSVKTLTACQGPNGSPSNVIMKHSKSQQHINGIAVLSKRRLVFVGLPTDLVFMTKVKVNAD